MTFSKSIFPINQIGAGDDRNVSRQVVAVATYSVYQRQSVSRADRLRLVVLDVLNTFDFADSKSSTTAS